MFHSQIPSPPSASIPLDGWFTPPMSMLLQTVLAAGCSDNFCKDYDAVSVTNAVQAASAVVVCLGTGE